MATGNIEVASGERRRLRRRPIAPIDGHLVGVARVHVREQARDGRDRALRDDRQSGRGRLDDGGVVHALDRDRDGRRVRGTGRARDGVGEAVGHHLTRRQRVERPGRVVAKCAVRVEPDLGPERARGIERRDREAARGAVVGQHIDICGGILVRGGDIIDGHLGFGGQHDLEGLPIRRIEVEGGKAEGRAAAPRAVGARGQEVREGRQIRLHARIGPLVRGQLEDQMVCPGAAVIDVPGAEILFHIVGGGVGAPAAEHHVAAGAAVEIVTKVQIAA